MTSARHHAPACPTEPLAPLTPPASPTWHGPRQGATSAEEPLRGTPYRFVRALGARGAMGELVEAEHTALGRRVVVKLLGSELEGSEEYADRMRLEAQALAAISHPHVVTVLDVGKTPEGRTFLVMEKLVGRTLGEELAARGFLPVAEAVALVRQLLDGLDAAHAAGLVHRDVKPANVFLCDATRGPRVLKLIDFGIAKVVGRPGGEGGPQPLAHPTAPLSMVGTPRWMAPEQIVLGPVGPWSDLYSAGAVLYALVTGRDPFSRHRDAMSLIQAHVEETPPLPSVGAPQAIPEGVERAIMKALEKRPGDRWASAADFSAALAHALAPRTVGGGTAIQPSPYAGAGAGDPAFTPIRPADTVARSRPAFWGSPPRTPWRAAGTAVAVAAVIGVLLGGAFLGRRRHRAWPSLPSASPLASDTPEPAPAVPTALTASSATAAAGATATANPAGSAKALPFVASMRPLAVPRTPRRAQASPSLPTAASVAPLPPATPTKPPASHRPFGVEE